MKELAYLEELCGAVVEASRVRPGEVVVAEFGPNRTGGTLIRPGGRQCYPAFWIRDYAMSLPSGFISVEEQRHALQLTAATQQLTEWRLANGAVVPRGAIADHINFDGTPIFYPGTMDPAQQGGIWGPLPALDDHFYFVQMAGHYVAATGDRAVLDAEIGGVTLRERLELAFAVPPSEADTALVNVSEANRGVSFGFTDAIVHTGALLFCSLLKYQAAEQLAALLGDARYDDIAARIRAALPVTFRHAGSDLLAASTGHSAQPDVWGSAYAVSIGAVRGELVQRISRALVAAYQAGTLAYHGNIRHVLTTDDASATSAWERLVSPIPHNIYQNGAYWDTPTGWVYYAMRLTDPDAAERLAAEYLDDLRAGDFRQGEEYGAPYECIHPDGGYRQNAVYMTSVTCPLAAFRRSPAM